MSGLLFTFIAQWGYCDEATSIMCLNEAAKKMLLSILLFWAPHLPRLMHVQCLHKYIQFYRLGESNNHPCWMTKTYGVSQTCSTWSGRDTQSLKPWLSLGYCSHIFLKESFLVGFSRRDMGWGRTYWIQISLIYENLAVGLSSFTKRTFDQRIQNISFQVADHTK